MEALIILGKGLLLVFSFSPAYISNGIRKDFSKSKLREVFQSSTAVPLLSHFFSGPGHRHDQSRRKHSGKWLCLFHRREILSLEHCCSR